MLGHPNLLNPNAILPFAVRLNETCVFNNFGHHFIIQYIFVGDEKYEKTCF